MLLGYSECMLESSCRALSENAGVIEQMWSPAMNESIEREPIRPGGGKVLHIHTGVVLQVQFQQCIETNEQVTADIGSVVEAISSLRIFFTVATHVTLPPPVKCERIVRTTIE